MSQFPSAPTRTLIIEDEEVVLVQNYNDRFGCDECDEDADWISVEGKSVDYAFCDAHLDKLSRLQNGDLGALALVDWQLCVVWNCPHCLTANSEVQNTSINSVGGTYTVTCSNCSGKFELI